jgi:hypothetical protein
MKEIKWTKVKPLPGAEHLIRNLVANNIPIAVYPKVAGDNGSWRLHHIG